MSFPKANVVTPERISRAKEFLDKLIREYEENGGVSDETLARLREMRQNLGENVGVTKGGKDGFKKI